MSGISISLAQLLIIGIPQGFIFVLGIYILTRTKFELFKYLILSSIVTLLTYLIRFLPISIGINSMLSLLVLILLFLITYKLNLPQIIRLIVSVIAIFLFICFSEILNEAILYILFGKIRTQDLLNSSSPLIKSISMIPTNIILAILVLVSYIFVIKIKNKKAKHGEVGKETGE